VFGNILTKLRYHIGNLVVVDISQAKMHIHDEHVSGREMKIRLKRHFKADGTVRGHSASSDVSSDISPSPLYIPPHHR